MREQTSDGLAGVRRLVAIARAYNNKISPETCAEISPNGLYLCTEGADHPDGHIARLSDGGHIVARWERMA